jgi:hypothetical protein
MVQLQRTTTLLLGVLLGCIMSADAANYARLRGVNNEVQDDAGADAKYLNLASEVDDATKGKVRTLLEKKEHITLMEPGPFSSSRDTEVEPEMSMSMSLSMSMSY